MLSRRTVSLAVFSALSFGVMGVALATTPYSTSTCYFDENGNLVGESILTCTPYSEHGGNVHTAYSVTATVTCYPCNPKVQHCPDPPDYIAPPTHVTDYTLPSFETLSEACKQMEGNCGIPAVITNKGWTWTVGYQ